MQVTINLNWNSSNHTYSLTSSNEKLCQISSDKQSYIIFGKTYTPIIQYDGGYVQRYKLVSYSFASASNVGVSSRSGTTSGSPNTTSNYSSDEVNYYTRHSTSPTYSYKTARIDIVKNPGEVTADGDTDACSFDIEYNMSTDYTYKLSSVTWKLDWGNYKCYSTTGSISSDGLSAVQTYEHKTTGAGLNARITLDPSDGTISGDKGAVDDYTTSRTGQPTYSYFFESVTWYSTWGDYDRVGSSDSDSGGAGYTYATKRYRKETSSGDTWYDPDFYSSFSFNAATGNITWSHRGGSTSYYDKVEQYSTINVEDASYYQYNITSLDWSYDGDEYGLCTIIEQTNSHMVIDIPDVGWVFIDETTSERKEGQLIKFIDEIAGTETMIKKVQANNNGRLSRYLRTTKKKS